MDSQGIGRAFIDKRAFSREADRAGRTVRRQVGVIAADAILDADAFAHLEW